MTLLACGVILACIWAAGLLPALLRTILVLALIACGLLGTGYLIQGEYMARGLVLLAICILGGMLVEILFKTEIPIL